MSDIRKWFMKQHDKGSSTTSNPAKPIAATEKSSPAKPVQAVKENSADNSARRKTSKYFANTRAKESSSKQTIKDENEVEKTPAKRKTQKADDELPDDVKPSPAKKLHKDDDGDFVPPSDKKKLAAAKPSKKLKSNSFATTVKKPVDMDEDDEDGDEDVVKPLKAAGRGRGGRGPGATSGGRGRGGGRGGFMNFGERKDPPHKGEKEVPEGSPDCLSGLTFVISGTLDSLEREEAEDLIKRYGGRVTGSISKKTSYLLADEDIGGNKSSKAKELGTAFLTEDGLLDMIRKSKPTKASVQESPKKQKLEKVDKVQMSSPMKVEVKNEEVGSMSRKIPAKGVQSSASLKKQKDPTAGHSSLPWTEKYRPKVPNEIIGNQSIVKQLHDWLMHWNEHFMHTGQKGRGKKQNDNSGPKKAVLISGSPGIGKTTSAKLVSQMLGFETIEVNASDNRGKADAKIVKGIGGNKSNSIKVLITNEAMGGKDWSKYPKSVLIMDEVDGMSAGDRGGVADLIASIKISKIPIICICNDRYSQKLKSLVNNCMPLNFRKPTKQQMAKRLMQIAVSEGIQVNEIALEELANRVNGDMRMALNQLQYMSLSLPVIKFDDMRERLLNSAKDEDISPFTAVDKLFGFNAGKMRMDERIDFSMSDPDLVPLIIQENYINYRPSSIGKDESGVKRMNLIARAAESIADGDIVNVQIRRYRQWQLSQAGSFASSIVPAALMHGQREVLEPGERNYNRFGGWLGKNSTTGKNLRLVEDTRIHILSSQECKLDRQTLRVDYFSLLLKQLTVPLKMMPKDAAVRLVVEFMDTYSLSQEDFDTIVELSKFQGHPNPMDGIEPAVKSALTRAYKQASGSRVVRVADMITLPGVKKAPIKRIAAILEPVDSSLPEGGDALAESEEENSDAENPDVGLDNNGVPKPQLELLQDKPKGVRVELELKSNEKSSTKRTPVNKKRGVDASVKGGRGSGGGKRKR